MQQGSLYLWQVQVNGEGNLFLTKNKMLMKYFLLDLPNLQRKTDREVSWIRGVSTEYLLITNLNISNVSFLKMLNYIVRFNTFFISPLNCCNKKTTIINKIYIYCGLNIN